MKQFIVKKEEAGKRIDAYISNKDEQISRTAVQRLIEEESILVNGNKTKASYKVQENDEIEIQEVKPKEIELKAQEIPLEVIYEDEDIIVINKPKGLVVHPAAGNPDGTLVNAIMAICKDSLSGIGGEVRPGIVHRLDKDTSGITIFAKSDYIQDMLIKQMKENIFKKEYLAITEGIFTEKEGLISAPIARKYGSIIEREIKFNEDPSLGIDYKPYPAETLYKVITENQKDNLSLVNYTLLTGRTHQIRLHSKYKGAPLLGDYLYNRESDLISRQALHSYKITFIHPITKKPLEFTAKLPDDMENIITKFNLK